MNIYHYDAFTGAYTGAGLADEDQMAPGEFILPAFSVTVPPPAPQTGKIQAWDGTAWGYIDLAPDVDPVIEAPSVSLAVNAERDRRLALGVLFEAVAFQTDETAIANITGASTGAITAIVSGAQHGDLRWADASRDFGWIATDNTVMPMDAFTMIEFGKVAMSYVFNVRLSARDLKDRIDAGEDPQIMYAADQWPVGAGS